MDVGDDDAPNDDCSNAIRAKNSARRNHSVDTGFGEYSERAKNKKAVPVVPLASPIGNGRLVFAFVLFRRLVLSAGLDSASSFPVSESSSVPLILGQMVFSQIFRAFKR